MMFALLGSVAILFIANSNREILARSISVVIIASGLYILHREVLRKSAVMGADPILETDEGDATETAETVAPDPGRDGEAPK